MISCHILNKYIPQTKYIQSTALVKCRRLLKRQGRREERREGGGRRKEGEERRGAEVASKNKNPTLRMWGIKQ